MDGEEGEVALRILHTADWHVGRRFRAFEEEGRRKLARARLEVLERIMGLAERHQVDAVLCAGDLFDEPSPEREYYQRVAAILKQTRRAGRPVVLLPGNHDPLIPGSVWSAEHEFRRLLPEEVIVVDRPDFELSLGEDAVLVARPCDSKAGQLDNAMLLPERQQGDQRIRIGMVHGSTFDIPGHQMHFPIAKDAAIRRGLDYLAIGDTHAFRRVPEDAKVPTVYPSAPEQLRFDEEDTGYVAVVLFMRRTRRAIVKREKVARWRWRHEKVTSLGQLRKLAAEDLTTTVLRLELDLAVDAAEYEEIEQILGELRGSEATHGRAGVLDVRRGELLLETGEIEKFFEGMPSVLQQAVARLKDREEAAPEEARRALYQLYKVTRELAPS